MKRPYEYVPLIGLIMMIDGYTKLAKDDFKLQKDLDEMVEELNIRFGKKFDNQISIDEYLRSRNNE